MRPSLDESDGKPVMRTDTTRKLLWLDAADTAGPPLQFEYDGVLAAEDGQERVYTEIAQPLVDAATVGRAACLMCYGQTGTGKTYTFGGALAARPSRCRPAHLAPPPLSLRSGLGSASALNGGR